MVIAVIAVRMVQVRADEVIEMIAVGHGLMAAACPVRVRLLVVGACMARRARVRVLLADREHVLIEVIAVRMMQVSIVQVIDVVLMTQRLMSTSLPMNMGVRFMCLVVVHRLASFPSMLASSSGDGSK
ncbi:hypothetical protein [Sorangium sp. So ce124]|uniref:hypothetical protein n=1 Tax=Sorangium sp. So ce124 TaxID=3133280 RepID=UPI003F628B1C